MNRKSTGSLHAFACILALWLAWALRLLLLGDKSIWWDEGWTVWTIRKGFSEIARWTAADTHPPLYFWLLSGWRALVGEGEWLLRFPSVGAGLLMVAVAVPVGKRLGGWKAALGAALLLALHRFAIRWSQEIRMYALAALFAFISVWALMAWLENPGRRKAAWGYVISTTLALYTLYLSGMTLVAENLAVFPWLIWKRRWKLLFRWSTLQGAIIGLLAPWFLYALQHMRTWSVAEPFSPAHYLWLWSTILTTGAPAYLERYIPLVAGWSLFALIVLGAILAGIRMDFRAKSEEKTFYLGLFLCCLLVPLGFVYLLSIPRGFLYTPRLEARYLLFSLPAFALLMAWAVKEAKPLMGREMAGAFLVLATALWVLPEYYAGRHLQDDYISIGAMLRLTRAEDEGVVLHTDMDWPVFAAHYPGEWVGIPNAQPLSQEWLDGYLGPLWERSGGLWLVQNPDALRADPGREVTRWLERRGDKVAAFRVGPHTLTLYRKRDLERKPFISQEVVPLFLNDLGRYKAGIPLHRMRTGDETALLVCGSEPASLILSLGDFEWLSGDFKGSLGCELFPLVAPPLSGRYPVMLRIGEKGTVKLGVMELEKLPLPQTYGPGEMIRTSFEWEGGLRLLGYKLGEGPYQPGGKFKLAMHWQAGRPEQVRLVLFVHVLGEVYNASQGNFLWGQRDAEPALPSTAWLPGQGWVEEWEVPILPSAPSGRYKLELGWYDMATGKRLPLVEPEDVAGADSIILAEIEVRGTTADLRKR